MRLLAVIPTLLMALLISACGGGGSVDSKDAPVPSPTATPENPIGDDADFTPNSFLNFVNEQRSLGAGGYDVVVGTKTIVDEGSFDIELTFDDGSTSRSSGAWSANSGGGRNSPYHPGNPRFPVELTHAGGLRVGVESAADVVIYLVRGTQVIALADSQAAGQTEVLDLVPSQINSATFSMAYYAAVDPANLRTTLEGWKAANGFGSDGPDSVINATFRDAQDLGYGRDMYAWERPGDCGVAVFENNYVVQLERGDASTYGPINLDAAIARDSRFLRGSNAIEYGPPGDGDCGDPTTWIVSFYTFSPPDDSGVQTRLTAVDFDGRGVKFMPGVCTVCHGGTLHPPVSDDQVTPGMTSMLSDITLKSTTFNTLHPDSLEFSSQEGFRFEDQRVNIEAINALVASIYSVQDARVDTVTDVANWSPTFAIDLLAGLSDGQALVRNSTYVPPGWRADPTTTRPDNVESLYKEAVEPYCIGCHSLRGNKVGEANAANAVNFSSWERFDAYRDTISDYVFRRGKMPLSLISYSRFWDDPDAPVLVAEAVGLPDAFREGGRPREPGRPVARPGQDRTVFFPLGGERTIELDGSASDFSSAFAWSVVEAPDGAAHTLEDEQNPVSRLTVNSLPAGTGTFLLRLSTSNQLGSSDPAEGEVAVTFTTEMLDDRDTVFAAAQDQQGSISIEALLENAGCAGCHNSDSGLANLIGIPVYFRATSYPPGELKRFYQAVMARVDLADPENSLLLRKPTTDLPRHGGGQVIEVGGPEYNMILNWIRAGAPCGGNDLYCDFDGEGLPPDAPSDLRADMITFNQARLLWRDNAVNESGFEVERAVKPDASACEDVPAASFSTNTAPRSDDFSTTFLDTVGLDPETSYCYRVRAFNGPAGALQYSDYSNFALASTDEPPSPPAPTGLTITPVSATELRLTWQPGVADDPEAAAVRFDVLRSDATNTTRIQVGSVLAVDCTPQCVFDDSNLTPDTSYDYIVRAVSSFETTADAQATRATPMAPPAGAPEMVDVQPISGTATQLRVTWQASSDPEAAPAVRFEVYRRAEGETDFTLVTMVDAASGPNFQFDDMGLSAATTYFYRVRAITDLEQTADSIEFEASTPTPPDAPTLTVVPWSDTQLQLNWTSASGATEYQVLRNGVSQTVIPGTSFRDSALSPNTSYTYVVRALNDFGQSTDSNSDMASTVVAGATLFTGNCSACHGPAFAANNPNGSTFRNAAGILNRIQNVPQMNGLLSGDGATVQFARIRAICQAGTAFANSFSSCDVSLP